MCRLIGLQLLRGGDTNITFIFYRQKDTVLCSPQPQTTVYRKKIYSFDVMLSELVFSFMLKFEVKKKKRERAGGVFWGGVSR